MTAPHPFPPRLVAVAALATLFFILLAMWLPGAVSEIDIGSRGDWSAEPEPAGGATTLGASHSVFEERVTSPLWLLSQPGTPGPR